MIARIANINIVVLISGYITQATVAADFSSLRFIYFLLKFDPIKWLIYIFGITVASNGSNQIKIAVQNFYSYHTLIRHINASYKN